MPPLLVEGAPPALDPCARMVRAQYLADPGLSLTLRQMQRLWGMDRTTGEAAVQSLVAAGFLEPRPNGTFVRVDAPGRSI